MDIFKLRVHMIIKYSIMIFVVLCAFSITICMFLLGFRAEKQDKIIEIHIKNDRIIYYGTHQKIKDYK